jgi:hypothetical protein
MAVEVKNPELVARLLADVRFNDGETSEEQIKFLALILERNEISVEQCIEQYPALTGWRLLRKMRNDEHERRAIENSSRLMSLDQKGLLEAYMAVAKAQDPFIHEQIVRTLKTAGATMTQASLMLDVCDDWLKLESASEKAAEELIEDLIDNDVEGSEGSF